MKIFGRILQIIGVMIFILGIIMGILLYVEANDDIDALNTSTKNYKTVLSNGYTEADYVIKRNLYLNDMTTIALWGGLAAISGFVGIGAGSIMVRIYKRDNKNVNDYAA